MAHRRIALAAALMLVIAACGDSGDTTTSTTAPPATTAATTTTVATTTTLPATTTTTLPAGLVTDLTGVRDAVIRIEATGVSEEPSGSAEGTWWGSGFFIDSDGLAVTNNHVVTGAAFLQVYVEGEDQPRNARILGVSECSDLAVIDVDGDGFSYLEWHGGDVVTGLSIYAAGFPSGVSADEYTLLDGIVAKEAADGETTWASVDAVIEHSAETGPGNSGGPVVTGDGRVVAVHYAGTDAGQSFAISRDVALPVIGQLVNEIDVHAIGVNGFAVNDFGGFSGIWVFSVETGSPADGAGVRPGDIITRLEGLALSRDGTMAAYCDILRSHAGDDVLRIEVYRSATDEVLEGQVNGTPMVVITSFAAGLDDQVPDNPGGGFYNEYVTISDDSGAIVVQVPLEWSDVNGVPWNVDGDVVGAALSAAPDLEAWISGWDTPGVFIGASTQLAALDPADILDSDDFSGSCDFVERLPYDDGFYFGAFDWYENCGGDGGSIFVQVAAHPADGSFLVLVQIVIVTDADLDAADSVLGTFDVVGEL